jgi:hypothetical protein
MSERKKNDNAPKQTVSADPPKLTRRDALKRIALTAVGIAVLPQATFMNPSEALADEIYVPRYRSYARDFSRGYSSYSSYYNYYNYYNYIDNNYYNYYNNFYYNYFNYL